MRIGIDISYAVNEGTGVGRYSFELVKALLKVDRKNEYWLYANFFFDRAEKTRKLAQLTRKARNVHLVVTHLPGQLKDWIFWAMPSLVRVWLPNLDLFHALTFQATGRFAKKLVLTIHDLSYFEQPRWYGEQASFFQNQTRRAYRLSSCIIAPSRATKQAVERYLGKRKPVSVVPEGVARRFFIKKRELKSLRAQKLNVLAVGTGPRKNIDAIAKLLPLTQLKHADDKQLIAAYRRASVLVYPSLSEGFGLPVLEAMAAGVPVVTSKTSAMAEFARGAALLVDPKNAQEIAVAVKRILNNPNLAKKLSNEARRIAKNYSWANAARATLRVYQGG